MNIARTSDKLSLTEHIIQRLLAMINHKELLVGEKLPSENELCAVFNASRTSVRAALQNLQGKGVITTVQGVGSFVRRAGSLDSSPAAARDAVKGSTISSDEFKEFFEFRQAIEFRCIDFLSDGRMTRTGADSRMPSTGSAWPGRKATRNCSTVWIMNSIWPSSREHAMISSTRS